MQPVIKKEIKNKCLVVGPIYDKIEKLDIIEKISTDYEWIVLNGNIYLNLENMEKIKEMPPNVIYNLGKYDLLTLNDVRYSEHKSIKNWILSKSNSVILEFISQVRYIVVDGGILPKTSINSLSNNLEISFISQINKSNWHELYNGNIGYIISNNPIINESPKFYKYSMQLGNNNFKLYAQELDKYGLKNTINLSQSIK